MDFLFKFFDNTFSVSVGFFRYLVVSTRKTMKNLINERAAKNGRISLENKIRFNLFEKMKASHSFCVPQPCGSSVCSFFRSFMDRPCKFLFEIRAYVFVNRTNLKRRLINFYKFWLLSIDSTANATIAICISSQVSVFHVHEYYRQADLMSMPATTNRLRLFKKRVCYSLNS